MNKLFKGIDIGSIKLVKEALEDGINTNSKNRDGDTPLRLAVIKRNVQNGWCDRSYNKYRDNDYLNIIKLLLEYNANPNIKSKILGSTPLLLSVYRSDYELTNLMIKHGVNLNIKNKLGNTPLMAAAKYGPLKLVKLLLEHGAKLLIRNNNGYTAYYEAYRNSNYEIEKYLELWPVIKIQRKYKKKLQKRHGSIELLKKTILPEEIVGEIINYV